MSQPTWMVYLADRFGNPQRDITNNVVALSGEPLRVIDNVSDISVTLVTDNYNLVCETAPWANEVQLWADGEIAWGGPITNSDFDWETGTIDLTAKDLLHWLEVRVLRERIEAGPVSAQFAKIIELAMADDDIGLAPPIQFVSAEADLRITDISSAKSEILDLAPFLDFTMHGRTLLVGAEEVPFSELRGDLVLPDMGNFVLSRNGDEEASQVWVRGGDSLSILSGEEAVEPNTGIASERATGSYPVEVIPDPNIGVVQRRVYDTSILSDATARKVAYSAFKYAEPPLFSVAVTLDMARTPFRFNDLVAGSTTQVNVPGLDCFPAQRVMRIKTVGLSIEPSEEGLTETISLDLIPAGIFTNDLADID